MAIKRNEYAGSLAIGSRIKQTTVSSLDAVTETSQLVADTITTARSTMELIHGSLQPAIAEQEIEFSKLQPELIQCRLASAKALQAGVAELVAGGMSETDAMAYLTN